MSMLMDMVVSVTQVLKLKGLPYSTTEQQIVEFFTGYQIKKIAFVYEPDGRPSGLAFAEFETKEQALQVFPPIHQWSA